MNKPNFLRLEGHKLQTSLGATGRPWLGKGATQSGGRLCSRACIQQQKEWDRAIPEPAN